VKMCLRRRSKLRSTTKSTEKKKRVARWLRRIRKSQEQEGDQIGGRHSGDKLRFRRHGMIGPFANRKKLESSVRESGKLNHAAGGHTYPAIQGGEKDWDKG